MTRRQAVLWLWAAAVALCVFSYEPVCVAQGPDVPPPGVPASLFVKDRFARAVKNQSSAPYYLMATVVNDTTGETKRVCIEGTALFDAVRRENKLGYGKADFAVVRRLILDNPSRTYHFRNSDAWQHVQPRYSPQMLALVQERSQKYSTAQLAALFAYDRKNEVVLSDKPDKSPAEMTDFSESVAHVLTDRGLLATREDFSGTLYVVTPQMLVKQDREEERQQKASDAADRKEKAEGQQFAARLPGFNRLRRKFNLRNAYVSDYRQGFCFYTELELRTTSTLDYVDWLNPVSKKTQKARYTWNQFLPIAAHAERLVGHFPWLQAWKGSGSKRTIEAEMYGVNLHSEYDEDVLKDIVPAWKDAGLSGKPYCELILRWQENGEGANATVYLPLPGSGENRSLIVSSRRPYHATGTAGAGAHWLDGLSFHSYAIADPRQCVVVTPSGDWKRLTLPTHAPTKPPLSKETKP